VFITLFICFLYPAGSNIQNLELDMTQSWDLFWHTGSPW